MKKSFFISFTLIAFGSAINAYASGDGMCHKCEGIREYNRTHPSKYVYYEDYLKDKEDGKVEEENNDRNYYVPPQKQPKKTSQPTNLRQTQVQQQPR